MAYYRKLKSNKWRAEIERNGERRSSTFLSKKEAELWATQEEAKIMSASYQSYPDKTFSQAIDKYITEISSKKAGYRYEILRLNAFKRDFPELVKMILSEIKPAHMAKWRDNRLKLVTAGSVQREMNLLSNLFMTAKKEWGWCADSPLSSIKRPGHNPSRERRVLPKEVKIICRKLGYITGSITNKQQEVALAFLIGLHTGMRAGEILSLNRDRVDLKKRVVKVSHKTQYITGKERSIPITAKAARLISYLFKRGQFFTIQTGTLDVYFRRAKDQAKINDLHFHDSRAEALTRLSRRVDVMTLAKISGHKDLKILLNTYYRESAEDIAARI